MQLNITTEQIPVSKNENKKILHNLHLSFYMDNKDTGLFNFLLQFVVTSDRLSVTAIVPA